MQSPPRHSPRRRPLSIGRRITFGLLTALLALLALEGLLRLAAHAAGWDSRVPWYEISPVVGWRPRPGGVDSEWQPEPHRFDLRGYPVEDTRQLLVHRRPRVVGLGDSTMYGFGVRPGETYLEQLDRRFPEYDCINLAVPGYSSFNGYQRLQAEALALDPALLVISFNFNDRRWVLDGGSRDSEERFEWLARTARVERALRSVYILRALTRLLRGVGLGPAGEGLASTELAAESGAPDEVDLAQLTPRVAPYFYRENLVQIVSLARRHDIGVVFMLTGDNPDQTRYLRRGWRLERAGEADDAIEAYRQAVALRNPFSPLARIHLAPLLEERGDRAGAAAMRTVRRPFHSLLGGYPIVRDQVYQDVMRQVALDYTIPVVDLAGSLLERPELYLDFCHFNADAHAIAADLLADTLEFSGLRERLRPGAPSAPPQPTAPAPAPSAEAQTTASPR